MQIKIIINEKEMHINEEKKVKSDFIEEIRQKILKKANENLNTVCPNCGGMGMELVNHTNCPEPFQDFEQCSNCKATGVISLRDYVDELFSIIQTEYNPNEYDDEDLPF